MLWERCFLPNGKRYCVILWKKIVSAEIDFNFHRKTVIHEIIAKLLILSIKLWTNLHSAFWVLITSTLHLKMLTLMKRYLYVLKKLILDRDQKPHAAPCSWCCSNVFAVIFWSLFVSRPSVCFSYWRAKIHWFRK